MSQPAEYPDYVTPRAPCWRRWSWALVVLWGAQLGAAFSLWPSERLRQDIWQLAAIVPLFWALALALRHLVWRVGLFNRDAYRHSLGWAQQAWWAQRRRGLPVDQVLLLGPVGDDPAQYRELMADAATPLPTSTGEATALRYPWVNHEGEERAVLLARQLARQLLALPDVREHASRWGALAWAGDAASLAAFTSACAEAGVMLPGTRLALNNLDDLSWLIDAFHCPENTSIEEWLCAGVVSVGEGDSQTMPGEAGFVWLANSKACQQVHRGEPLVPEPQAAADSLCARVQLYAGLDGPPPHCATLGAKSLSAVALAGWPASEHELSHLWGSLGALSAFICISLALLQTQTTAAPCGWLCQLPDGQANIGVTSVYGND